MARACLARSLVPDNCAEAASLVHAPRVLTGMTPKELAGCRESTEQIRLVAWLRTLPPEYTGVVCASLGETGRDVKSASYNKRMGYCRGFPDLAILRPVGPYHGLFIELKRTVNPSPVSASQREVIARLQTQGFYACVAYGYWQARIVAEAYLDGHPLPVDADLGALAAARARAVHSYHSQRRGRPSVNEFW